MQDDHWPGAEAGKCPAGGGQGGQAARVTVPQPLPRPQPDCLPLDHVVVQNEEQQG